MRSCLEARSPGGGSCRPARGRARGSCVAFRRRAGLGGAARDQRARPHVDPEVRDAAGDPAGDAAHRQASRQEGRAVDYYEIAVRQFRAADPPGGMGLGPTTVWSYGSVDHPADVQLPGVHDRGGVAQARARQVDQPARERRTADFLPHLLPVDQTLHWANPPGGIHGRDDARHRSRPRTAARCRSSPTCTAGTRPGERRLPRGLVPADGAATSRSGYATVGLVLPAVQGRSPRPARPGVDARAAPSSSTTTTSARRRCGTTTTRSG